jgi:alkylation response protein AidB-like acyl-CoA dehydrogenase
VRAFVRDEIKPVTLHPKRLEPFEKPLLTDLLAAASNLGLRALALSEAHGGAGADTLTACIVVEELAQGDPDIAVVLAHTTALARVLFDDGMSAAQRERFLPAFTADAAFHLAYAGRNPGAGLAADYHRARSGQQGASVSAVKHAAGDWVLNGEAGVVANAGVAKLFAIGANTAGGDITLLASRDTSGLTVQEVSGKRGGATLRWGHGAAGKVVFHDCRISAANRLTGDIQARYASGVSPLLAAANIGIGQVAFEAAIDYTKLRRQGGKKTIEHQAIGTFLAEIAIKLEAARTLAWKAAWALDHPDAIADRSVSGLPLHHMARAYTSELMVEVTERAAECFGAMGVMRDMPLQKYVDDALMFRHGEVGAGAAKLLIAEAVAGFQRAQS